jgi:multimeric flavodoxin WrbA
MKNDVNRRSFLVTTGAAAVAATTTPMMSAQPGGTEKSLKILGVACSSRQGMTTATAVRAALNAAQRVDQRLKVELIDLGGLHFAGWQGKSQPADDFNPLLPKLKDPAVAGWIMGSPCYFRSMSSICKAFIERCMPLRSPTMLLEGKPMAALAVGGFRNGGQELVIAQIQTAMLSFGMIPVGGYAPAHLGATLLNSNDSVDEDELGLRTAELVGKRLGEVALQIATSRA